MTRRCLQRYHERECVKTISHNKKKICLGSKLSGLLISVTLIGGSVCLKGKGFISEPSFVIFVIAGILIGLFIAYAERVKSVNLTSGELVLSEIERKHEDILRLETSVKRIASATLDMVEVSRAGSWAVTEDENKRYDLAKERLTELLNSGK